MRMHRFVVAAVVPALLFVGLVVPAGVAEARPSGGGTTLSNGNWIGNLFWTGSQRGTIGSGETLTLDSGAFEGGGNLTFTVQGSQVEDGAFGMVVEGAVFAHDSGGASYDGTRTMTYSGQVAGTAGSPCLEGQYEITGDIVVSTPAGPLRVSLRPGDVTLPVDCAEHALVLDSASCDEASGTFAIGFPAVNEAYGLRLDQRAEFVLYRVGNRFSEAQARANSQQLAEWADQVQSLTPGNAAALLNVLLEVERSFGNAPRNAGCGRPSDSPGRTAIAAALRTMTLGYLDRVTDVSVEELRALIHANFMTNGSTWTSTDPEIRWVRNELYASLDDLVGRLEAARDTAGLTQVAEIARTNGWNRIAANARAAQGRIGA